MTNRCRKPPSSANATTIVDQVCPHVEARKDIYHAEDIDKALPPVTAFEIDYGKICPTVVAEHGRHRCAVRSRDRRAFSCKESHTSVAHGLVVGMFDHADRSVGLDHRDATLNDAFVEVRPVSGDARDWGSLCRVIQSSGGSFVTMCRASTISNARSPKASFGSSAVGAQVLAQQVIELQRRIRTRLGRGGMRVWRIRARSQLHRRFGMGRSRFQSAIVHRREWWRWAVVDSAADQGVELPTEEDDLVPSRGPVRTEVRLGSVPEIHGAWFGVGHAKRPSPPLREGIGRTAFRSLSRRATPNPCDLLALRMRVPFRPERTTDRSQWNQLSSVRNEAGIDDVLFVQDLAAVRSLLAICSLHCR